ncbi:hypothetical protein [Paractinoplanes toevensis]|uniref:HEPN/Toprim N-terminal domain-containing protein n=1 Tax=Paractinoplanes toevensis TaxID=571911 RepID=A0A919T851_9ACTN|nr:hypothetical protein [Actinoplanes toevensis]GIM89836.1 hypothetical protein Ato02nite_016290 [Actinoplanes toevensis]
MFRAAAVRVGPYTQMWHENDESRLLAAFTNGHFQEFIIRTAEFYNWLGARPGSGEISDDEIEVRRYEADAREVAERLDLLGFDLNSSLRAWEGGIAAHADYLAENGRDSESVAIGSMGGPQWLSNLSQIADHAPVSPFSSNPYRKPLPGSPEWLIRLAQFAFDPLLETRLVVAAFPRAKVAVDVTTAYWAWVGDDDGPHAAAKLNELRRAGSLFSPVVVLTEGRTDAEFLTAGLSILYPHLVDLVKFLDFEQKNDGGAGALVRLVKSFAAAGIANRTVAIFDNDSAATDALRPLDLRRLPSTIRILRYPDLPLASSYPTIGPPSLANPEGGTVLANVNGLAGSIEMYLGSDVLLDCEGVLSPVRWGSLIPAIGSYQGEIANKADVHRRFREKVAAAKENPSIIATQDWSGVREILQTIMGAFTA